MRVGLLSLWLLGCGSGLTDTDKPPEEVCDNLEDDDLDDLADCADPDCAAVCGEVCTNGIDDDLDGLTDCLDDNCDGLCPENCGDGRDNDGDGAIDCDDRDCFGSCPEVCGDGADNDGDGKVDCLDEDCVDPSCVEVCTDGRDNDADGLVDCADDDCVDPACAEDCFDGRDNDADGRADCDDSDCDGDCPEICDDRRDNDGDGRVDCDDEECEPACDADGDGFVTDAVGGDDCDDSRPDVNPSRPEICNPEGPVDDDCDGLVDEDDPDVDARTLVAWGPDADGDGYGTAADVRLACQPPDGWGFANLDCDDRRADVNPGMPEICNPEGPLDDDCDGLVDDADPDVSEDSFLAWYADRDGDGFGSGVDFIYACGRPPGAAASDDDCDDDDPAVGPPSLWFADADGDGFGAGLPVDPVPSCEPPRPGLSPDWVGVDCDDAAPLTYPGAPEVCEDGVDQDCDGVDLGCCDVVDDFEEGVWPTSRWEVRVAGGTATRDCHDGAWCVTDPDWHYQTDLEWGDVGDVLSVWVKVPSGGRTYIGFDASDAGCKSFVLAPNTSDIRFQENIGFGYSELTIAPYSFTPGAWYYAEVENVGGGTVEGRLFNAGLALVASVRHTYPAVGRGGAAIRSFSGHIIDTMDVCY